MNEIEEADRPHLSSAALDRLAAGLAVLLTLGAVAWATDLFRMVGLVFYTEQYLGGMLAIAIPLVYLAVPAGRGRYRTGRVPWYDGLAAALGVAAGAYAAYRFPILTELVTARPLDGMVTGAVMLVLLTEGLRRTVGTVLTLVVVFFLLFTLVGHLVPGILQGRPVAFGKLVYYLAWDTSAVLGTPMRIVTTIVVAFVLFGQLLFKSGGSAFFTDIAMVLMGRYRGGPAKISVFASALFGSISGSVVSNVVTTGVITIPLMRNGGYRAHLAGAIEAVASTGGQLMPPVMGAAAFLMAEFLQITYAEVIVAALIPAILYYLALFLQADLEAARSGIAAVARERIPAAGPVLRSGWFFPVPFVVLIVALFWLNYLPETAALLAVAVIAVSAMTLGYRGKRLGVADLFDALRGTGFGVLDIIMIGAAAGMVIGCISISGLGFALTQALVLIAGGNLVLLLVMAAVVCIVLGMGMPTVGVYVLLAALVAPALVEVGIQPIAAHMFILYFGMMSMITPPVAIGAYAAATLTGADPLRTGFAAMRFGWLAFVIPFLFVLSPTLLMQGDAGHIVLNAATATLGVWLICMGMMGYFLRPLGIAGRLVFAVAGLALMLPAGVFALAPWLNLAGACVGGAMVAYEFYLRGRRSPASAAKLRTGS